MSRVWLASLGLMSSMLVQAEEVDIPNDIEIASPWNTEVEFGYQSHSGNSDSQSLNSRLSAEYTVVA